MSATATLQAMCIRKSCDLLMSGTFDERQVNPFSCMPFTVVQGLLSCIWAQESTLSRGSIAHSRLLLTSGRLQCVVLPRTENEEDYVTLLRMLSRGCQNLQTLSEYWRDYARSDAYVGAEQAFQGLLQNCAKLEHLHACTYFDPNHLWECIHLKSLSLHFGVEKSKTFYRLITSDLLRRLGSIEVFALCRRPLECEDVFSLIRATVLILNNCPRLTSLGYCESSAALKKLHATTKRGTPHQFQLRKCYWVDKGVQDSRRVRIAALSCPLVKVLMIEVHFAVCLQHLKSLTNLACLHMTFGKRCDYGQELHSLLAVIGHQLQHLAVYGHKKTPLSLSAICGNCPYLSTLQLNCAVVPNDAKPCFDLLYLKRLRIEFGDQESLLFLLSNCQHLQVLCLEHCMDLKDDTMQRILWKNPFAHLEVAIFSGNSLSELGYRRFLQSAQNLKKCCLGSELVQQDELELCVRDLNPSAVYHSPEDFLKLKIEQFPLDKNTSCWL